jgi:hypothetical protein
VPYYEVIFETGNHSVAQYNDDDEAQNALRAHHARATSGQLGTPQSQPRSDLTDADLALAGQTQWPAERIVRVLKYDNHPADWGVGQKFATSDINATVQQLTGALDKDGTVNVQELAAQIRDLTNPQVAGRENPHDSNYKMESTGELSTDWQTTEGTT